MCFQINPEKSETKEICERFSHELKFSHTQIQDSAENRPLKSFWKLGRSHNFPKTLKNLKLTKPPIEKGHTWEKKSQIRFKFVGTNYEFWRFCLTVSGKIQGFFL